jgi:midasin
MQHVKSLQCQLRVALVDICQKAGYQLYTPGKGEIERRSDRWGIWPFFLQSERSHEAAGYNFETETTHENLYRLLRAMQLSRPVLLEGSPGVGKTTLIEAMSRAVGKKFLRINLSDQTDMMDLLGANLPSPQGGPGEFVWSDGPLLRAMKSGSWVLLDELNLAGQSILEGLNALLDHRGEIFVPELNTVIKCAEGFRLFGAQNPVHEGGGRKGLPKSFLNRFIRVRVSGFRFEDLMNIAQSVHHHLSRPIIRAMTECLWQCAARASYRGQASVDFNLRDLLRWCKLVENKCESSSDEVQCRWGRFYGSMLLADRMRSEEDRVWIEKVLDEQLVPYISIDRNIDFSIDSERVLIGSVELKRKSWVDALQVGSLSSNLGRFALPNSIFGAAEALAECIKNNWLSVLVGPAGAGRSSSVVALGHMVGKKVIEIPMHPGIDISDLLGGFEQIDSDRDSVAILTKTRNFLRLLAVFTLKEGSFCERSQGPVARAV